MKMHYFAGPVLAFALAILPASAGLSVSDGEDVETLDVPFGALQGMTDKRGRTLDGSVKFFFADEKGPVAVSDELSARGSTFTQGDPGRACKLALLTAFISFQERAKREGMNAVVNIRTFATLMKFSKSRGQCMCRVGNRVFTTIKASLANVEQAAR